MILLFLSLALFSDGLYDSLCFSNDTISNDTVSFVWFFKTSPTQIFEIKNDSFYCTDTTGRGNDTINIVTIYRKPNLVQKSETKTLEIQYGISPTDCIPSSNNAQTTEIQHDTFPSPTTLDKMGEKPKETNKETLSPTVDSAFGDKIKIEGIGIDSLSADGLIVQIISKPTKLTTEMSIKVPFYVDIIVNTALGLLALLVVF